jgi:type VI secretion system secreted protein Hcp
MVPGSIVHYVTGANEGSQQRGSLKDDVYKWRSNMAIPVYLWLKDDGGADIKGSVDVKDREGSIEVVAQEHNLYIPTDNNTGS